MKNTKTFEFATVISSKYTLTQKEKAFCELYSNYGVSGADAIYDAGYKPKNRQTAYAMASENLRKPKFLAYIKQLYSEHSFSAEEVMREHLYLIRQHHDLSTKARAIDMYYKKNGMYMGDGLTVEKSRLYEDYSDAELIDAFQKKAKVSSNNL